MAPISARVWQVLLIGLVVLSVIAGESEIGRMVGRYVETHTAILHGAMAVTGLGSSLSLRLGHAHAG